MDVGVIADEKHRGLVVPGPGGGLVEYGFGDWNWYALGRDRWYHVFATVLWPKAGCFARREHPEGDLTALRQRLASVRLLVVAVPQARVLALRDRMERGFADRAADAHWNPRHGMLFVPCERSFWFANTCADQVADWLRELDCEVSWVPIRVGFRLQ